MGKYVIVDKDDKVIRIKKHSDILKSDIYRVSVLWVINSRDQSLLARRALNKSHDPGLWEPAAAGTLEINESYKENIIKEAYEEIGLTIDSKKLKSKTKIFLTKPLGWQFFCRLFIYKCDHEITAFKMQTDEVIDLKWFDNEFLEQQLITNKDIFVSNLDVLFKIVKKSLKTVDIG